jgi:outer membrane protein assembly factor BamD
MTEDELYQVVLQAFDDEDWDRATFAAERLLFGFPAFDREVEVRFLLAESFTMKEEYLSAASEYQRMMDRFPGHPRAADAALGICRSNAALSPHPQRDQAYTLQAMTACENVVADFPGTPQEQEAEAVWQEMNARLGQSLFEQGEFYYRRKMWDSAIIYFEDVLDSFSGTPAAPDALLHLYRCFMEIGWDDRAEEARERLLERYPDSDAAREIVRGQ